MMLSWEDPGEFRQGGDTVQFMILKDCSGCSVCGGGVGRAERRWPDKLEATAAQAVEPGLRGGRGVGERWMDSGDIRKVETIELADEREEEPEGTWRMAPRFLT